MKFQLPRSVKDLQVERVAVSYGKFVGVNSDIFKVHFSPDNIASCIPLRAGIRECPVDHLVVAAFIDADAVAACAAYSVAIGRTIAIVPVDPFLVASQDFSLADFVIPPELFPAGGAPQHQHTGTPLYSSGFFERIQHFSRFK
jgi:hypothetical protein